MRVKSVLTKPFHPFILAIYPILALFAVNIREVEFEVIIRPLIVSIVLSIILFLVIGLVLKDSPKTALTSSLLLILFYSYGHLYAALRNVNLFDANLGRHRYLFPIYVIFLFVGIWWILRKIKDTLQANSVVNLLSTFLLIMPIFQIFYHSIQDWSDQRSFDTLISPLDIENLPASEALPDIYYIVLDAYTRADALQIDFNFDNSPFLDELRSLGFYIADCSRTNYSYTLGAITSTLNLDYIPTLISKANDQGLGDREIYVLMKQSLVRSQLESIGYTTVAFATGYDWSQLTDADVYISLERGPFSRLQLHPFEFLLLKSSALLIVTDIQSLSRHIDNADFRHGNHITLQRFILDQLPKVASIPGPKFVFVHILIPHVPFVFKASGEIQTDPGFYSGKNSMPIDENYLREGYTEQIQFINSEILHIVTETLETSPSSVFVLQGDHGWSGENRLLIFNAYYLPDSGAAELYPTISPVNTFRTIFDTYLGTELGLLPDYSYLGGDLVNPIPETSETCEQLTGPLDE